MSRFVNIIRTSASVRAKPSLSLRVALAHRLGALVVLVKEERLPYREDVMLDLEQTVVDIATGAFQCDEAFVATFETYVHRVADVARWARSRGLEYPIRPVVVPLS